MDAAKNRLRLYLKIHHVLKCWSSQTFYPGLRCFGAQRYRLMRKDQGLIVSKPSEEMKHDLSEHQVGS